MSFREWGKRVMLGAELLIGAQNVAHATPTEEKPVAGAKAPEKEVTLTRDELGVIERLSKLISPDPEKQIWAQGKMAEKLRVFLANPKIKTETQRREAVKIYEEAGRKKLSSQPEATTPKPEQASWSHLQKQYSDGVIVDLNYRISTDEGKLQIETKGPVNRFSAINYLKGKTWASAPTPEGEDMNMWRSMIENDLRNLYLDTRILQELAPNSKEYPAVSAHVQDERQLFEQQFGSCLDGSSFAVK